MAFYVQGVDLGSCYLSAVLKAPHCLRTASTASQEKDWDLENELEETGV